MNGPRPGDKCEDTQCAGHLVVYTTRINFTREERKRYLRCVVCGKTAEKKWILPLKYAPQKKNLTHIDK